MDDTTKHNLLAAIMLLAHGEHKTLDRNHYDALMALCQTLDAPQYVTEYFARRAVTI